MILDQVVSVCARRHVDVWEIAAPFICRYISSRQYVVIVPDDDVSLFEERSPGLYVVVGESEYVDASTSSLLRSRLHNAGEYGWYLQQLIKFSALARLESGQVALIWDADTVPLRRLNFFRDGQVLFYSGRESHGPYFGAVQRLIGPGLFAPFSFVAQCFPCKAEWASRFFYEVSRLHSVEWQKAIIDSVDFSVKSGFSEYEVLGTFVIRNFPDEVVVQNRRWYRRGYGLVGGVGVLPLFRFLLSVRYDFVSFESWDKPFSKWRWLRSATKT